VPLRNALDAQTMWELLKTAYSEWSHDKAPRMSAALAYYSLFSVAPLLVIAVAMAGIVFGVQAAQGEIIDQIEGLLGWQGARAVQTLLESTHKPAHSLIATGLGLVALLFGASGVFVEMQDALDTIWHVRSRISSGVLRLIKARFLSFGMVLGVGFLLLVSLLFSAVLTAAIKYFGGGLAVSPAVLHSADFAFSVIFITLLFALIFKILPEAEVHWSDVWLGAALTSLLFTIGKLVIGFLVGKSALASAYGATGSLVILVGWTYYSAMIMYYGAEFTRVYASRRAADSLQP
jgi:membrane protein